MKKINNANTNGNSHLVRAKNAKNDEYYTRYEDVVAELPHYDECFRGKSIYCCCDSPRASVFWRYFEDNFDRLGLAKLVATHKFGDKKTSANIIEASASGKTRYDVPLQGDGDMFSDECRAFMLEADTVVTNPPFSLIRGLFDQLWEIGTDYLIIGPNLAITSFEVQRLVAEGRCRTGVNTVTKFEVAGGGIAQVACWWYTSLEPDVPKSFAKPSEKKKPSNFQRYLNYDAINVPRVAHIPARYNGVMGVPISFFHKWNPREFDIVGVARDAKRLLADNTEDIVFARLLIRRKRRHYAVVPIAIAEACEAA